MKPSVEKILKDVQMLSKRMRTREETADDLLNKVSIVQIQLNTMRQYQEESLQYADIANRTSNHPRRQLILCLAAENKQLEQLKIQNQTLETSLDEHQSALEMIMTKYREQISSLMKANEAEKFAQKTFLQNELLNKRSTPEQKISSSSEQDALMNERLLMMAAIAKEVTERSDEYSAELESELHRLRTENAGLRDLLNIGLASAGKQPQQQEQQTQERKLDASQNLSFQQTQGNKEKADDSSGILFADDAPTSTKEI